MLDSPIDIIDIIDIYIIDIYIIECDTNIFLGSA